ncbi:hypothetical protein V8F20_002941 [Naviculisporaceae sp. PSN 640]
MNLSIHCPSSNVYVQSSGPCVVCDGTSEHEHPQVEYLTVHPSCLSRVTPSASRMGHSEDHHSSSASVASSTSSCTSSTITNTPQDGLRLRLCSNCHELQSPLNFPMNNYDNGHSDMSSHPSPICYDCSLDMLDYDFGSPMTAGDSSTTATCWPAIHNSTESGTIICTACHQTKNPHEYSSYMAMSRKSGDDGYQNVGTSAAICNNCMTNISSGSGQDGQYHQPSVSEVDFESCSYGDFISTTPYQNLAQLENLTLGLSNTSDYDYNTTDYTHQPQGTSTTTPTGGNTKSSHPPRTKRKQTRRPKTGTGTSEGDSNSGNEYQEPVIQWISRRDPLPPNVCSRCRCRYVRPGKKQCQHCAYDYRGTRDHRASMGLCITCAEPLDRDNDYQIQGQGQGQGQGQLQANGEGFGVVGGGDNGVMMGGGTGSESGGTTAGVPGGAKPRRSCKACREKNRLKKAADKAAKLKMMAAGGGVDGNMGVNMDTSGGFHGGMIGGGERYVYRTS